MTNRRLFSGDFLNQIKIVASSHPDGIILREKDLSESEYISLAKKVGDECEYYGVNFIAHTFVAAARGMVHMPIDEAESAVGILDVGASCHSLDDIERAKRLGCKYATFGHVFNTKCKDGLPPRGLDELKRVCAINIPVYAIGGITVENARSVIEAGASGVCIMSGAMKSGALELIKNLRHI